MNRIQVRLASIQVVDGQGVAQSELELRLEVKDSRHTVIWPAPHASARVRANVPAFAIDQEVGTYEFTSPVTKEYNVLVTEADTRGGGQEDYGTGAIVFDLTPSTTALIKAVVIDLKRPKMKANGQVKVTMTAIRLPPASPRSL